MIRLAFFDTKPYDRKWFDALNNGLCEITFFEEKLCEKTASLAKNFDAVCVFVNDDITSQVIDSLSQNGIRLLAMRCAGYSNVDIRHAYGKLHIVRVPAYSPHAVAEFAMALLLTLNRKVHKAYNRTREFNFNIEGLVGYDLYGKTAGVIGTGKIGMCFAEICKGLGMNVVAYDLYPKEDSGLEYLPLPSLLKKSDVISLHCPLTQSTKHIINASALSLMKPSSFIINTSRGALIESSALISALDSGMLAGAALDVYEEEAELFYEDHSENPNRDILLTRLVSHPRAIVTSHQAFLTDEALREIAAVTLSNIRSFFFEDSLQNEVCYNCENGKIYDNCQRKIGNSCF